MENKILFMKNMQEGENELMKEIVRNMKEDKDNKWMSGVDKYLRKLGMNREDIGRMDKNEIKRRIKEYDSNIWKSKLMGKKNAKRYFENKDVMKEERIYDNRFSSVLLFRARTNVLGLNDRQRWKKGDTSCRLCGYEYEDLEHFLLDCKKLEGGRNKELIERKMVNGEDTVGRLLFDFADGDLEELKRMLQEMWSIRKKGESRTGDGAGWARRGRYFATNRGRGGRGNTKEKGVRGKRGTNERKKPTVSKRLSLPSSSWEK